MKHIILYVGLCLSLMACKPQLSKFETLPPLSLTLSCIPEAGAIIAAHRGTSRNWSIPENSISGLNKLIKNGYLIAEIDVARIGDGTLITFHDGVWDETSTGKGPIAASNRAELDRILLKTRRGKFTNDRPPLFEDMLKAAKHKIHLEIDFKSSVSMKSAIDIIRDTHMGDQVILIAYSANQAKKLRQLAPDMILSLPRHAKQQGGAGNLIWLGKDIGNSKLARAIKQNKNYVIGSVGQAANTGGLKNIRRNADILVTDYPEQYLPLTGLNKRQLGLFKTCLKDKGY